MKLLRDPANSLASAWAINSLAYSIIYPFIPIYLHEGRNLPMALVGTIFPLMGLAVILAPPLAGLLADRLGERPIMQFGQTSRGVMFLIFAAMAYFDAPFWLFAVGLMVNAGIGTFFQVGADAYLTGISTPETRPRMFSKIRIGTNVGWAVGPMLGAFLARTPFWLMFLMTAALCFFGAWYTGRVCGSRPRKARHPGEAASAAAAPVLSVGRMLRDHRLTRLLACSFLLFLLTSQLYSVLSVYSTGVVGISKTMLGIVYSVNGFVIIFCQLPVTWVFDRLQLSPAMRMTSGALLYTAGYFSLGFATGGAMLVASVFVLTLGEAAVMPALYSQVGRYAPTGGSGRYMAGLELVRGVGYAVGPYLGSLVFAALSGTPVLLWLTLASLGAMAAFGFRRIARREA